MARANSEIAELLQEYADLLKLEEGSSQAFRVRAYERAVAAVRQHPGDVADMSMAELQKLGGIGKSSAQKIREYVETGSISSLERLRVQYPRELMELTRIPGLGPKTVLQLRSQLGIENVDQLREAIAGHLLRELPGLGATSEEKISRAIERLGLHGKDRRTPIIHALPVARRLVAQLEELEEVKRAEYCGSLRRFSETIGDIDIVVAATEPEPVMQTLVDQPFVEEVIGRGETKTSVVTDRGMQVDLRVVAPSEFGAAVLYFTGSKAHNIQLRQRAIDRGLILNEYGLAEVETGAVVASRTEKAIYRALGMAEVPPEMREGAGEVEAAAGKRLPRLVDIADIRGDLHVHSTWSGDGRSSLEDMVAAAAARGLGYVAITEHGEDLAINGLSRADVKKERAVLDDLRRRHPDMRILHGSELNIGPDGSVDYDPDFLMDFDWCVASVHSHFDLDQSVQTERVLKAIANPAVSAIGHLTGRRIGKRPGIEIDVDAVFEAAAATGTAIEINSHLDRLDVSAENLVRARDLKDLRFVISTDAHDVTEFANMRWGVHNSRRGWVERKKVVNSWPEERFLGFVNAKRSRR